MGTTETRETIGEHKVHRAQTLEKNRIVRYQRHCTHFIFVLVSGLLCVCVSLCGSRRKISRMFELLPLHQRRPGAGTLQMEPCLLAPRAKSERGKKSEDKLCLGCETSPALVIFVTATITVCVSVFVFVFFVIVYVYF